MNQIFNNLKWEIYNDANSRTVNRMEKKLTLIIDKIENETNSDQIFLNYRIYMQVVDLLEDIDQLWHMIKNHSDNMDYVYYTLIQIEDVININIKHFDSSTYYDLSENSYPKISRTILEGKPYIHFLDSSSTLDVNRNLSEVESLKMKKG